MSAASSDPHSPSTSTLIDELDAEFPDCDVAAVLAEPGRSTPDEVRDELEAMGYDRDEIALVAPDDSA